MRGTITKIHPVRKAIHGSDRSFVRVEFQMEGGAWAKTDLVPTFRNYGPWRDNLFVGADLDDLNMASSNTVDADSVPRLVSEGCGTPVYSGDMGTGMPPEKFKLEIQKLRESVG